MSDKTIIIKVPLDTTQEKYEEITRLMKTNPGTLILPADFEVAITDADNFRVEYQIQRKIEPKAKSDLGNYLIIGWTVFFLGVFANMILEAIFL